MCKECYKILYYKTYNCFKNRKSKICLSCGVKRYHNKPEEKEISRQKAYLEGGIAYHGKIKRKKRKAALGIDINILFVERSCPTCSKKISYNTEKSALQAEENRRICKSCANIERHKQPGYTEKALQNARIASHSINGISKLERKIIPLIRDWGFKHITERENIHIGKYTPDFTNEEEKIILEIYGDYWHCNPKKYKNSDQFFPQLNMTAQQIWDKNYQRANFYEKQGYTFIHIWESDIKIV